MCVKGKQLVQVVGLLLAGGCEILPICQYRKLLTSQMLEKYPTSHILRRREWVEHGGHSYS